MSTLNEWFIFEGGAVDKKTCNKIKVLGEDDFKPAQVDKKKGTTDEERITGREKKHGLDQKTRISDISWTNEQWIYDLVWPFMVRANDEAGWRYHIKCAESSQITRYRKGGFYNFHQDGNGDHLSAYNNPTNDFLHGHVRKLSMSIMLNDNFDGGEFEFASYSKGDCVITPIKAKAGSIIIFPSSMEHRVAPVTKGTRYSLVTWFVGPPFV